MNDVTFTVESNMVNGEIFFYPKFSRPLTEQERNSLESVNLSRGGTRMYRLDQLDSHNGGGANWSNRNDGTHTEIAESKYRNRVNADLAAAWAASKANVAKAIAAKAIADAKAAAEAAKLNTSKTVFFAANGS